eukprot:PhF_6_TR20770/c0_g1_i1/m.29809
MPSQPCVRIVLCIAALCTLSFPYYSNLFAAHTPPPPTVPKSSTTQSTTQTHHSTHTYAPIPYKSNSKIAQHFQRPYGYPNFPTMTQGDDVYVRSGEKILTQGSVLWPQSNATNFPSQHEVMFGIFVYKQVSSGVFSQSLLRFVASLRHVNPTATMIVFLPTTIAAEAPDCIVKKYQVTLIPFVFTSAFRPKKFYTTSLRFTLIRMFLDRYRTFRIVGIADLKDVIFQLDPFHYAFDVFQRTGKEIVAAAEIARVISFDNEEVLDGRFTQTSLGLCLSNELFTAYHGQFMRKHVLCSGTTFGVMPGIYDYVAAMDEVFRQRNTKCAQSHMDQAVHNLLLYTNHKEKTFPQQMQQLSKRVHIERTDTGRFFTFHGVKSVGFDITRGMRVVNAVGVPFVLTHQFNRCPLFVNKRRLYQTSLLSESNNSGDDEIDYINKMSAFQLAEGLYKVVLHESAEFEHPGKFRDNNDTASGNCKTLNYPPFLKNLSC